MNEGTSATPNQLGRNFEGQYDGLDPQPLSLEELQQLSNEIGWEIKETPLGKKYQLFEKNIARGVETNVKELQSSFAEIVKQNAAQVKSFDLARRLLQGIGAEQYRDQAYSMNEDFDTRKQREDALRFASEISSSSLGDPEMFYQGPSDEMQK